MSDVTAWHRPRVQNMIEYRWIAAYLLAVSLISASVTAWDKHVSGFRGRRRVSERTLLLLAAAGGSIAMYLTMLLIRHKTKHTVFMLGIPVMIIAQYGLIFLLHGIMR